ncbi:aldehyde dehydrogenase [Citricoccus zhacaiensis]|uniref:Aldehyde dehydrogenase n=1 Tax=Citricoccus zhacaiensis TaxID=489142 RepID=A0ABQ2MCP6_9MICC|nr:aldehyde dehydrogenase family protein [Citricoccus zhacaiensis]GGO49581.1 aldehyde dehydrogenase [Citricoccus zhacaiensis]
MDRIADLKTRRDTTIDPLKPDVIQHWIDGATRPAADGATQVMVNPSTGTSGATVCLGTPADVDAAVASSRGAAWGWRKTASTERAEVIAALARLIRTNLEFLADLEIAETGKPPAVAASEVRGAAEYFEFYAGLSHLPQGEVINVTPDQHVYTLREPFGVVGVITPWNLPINQAARAVAPAITAGNVVVVKPAESTSQSTVALAQLATEAGLPNGVFNVVLGQGAVVGSAIIHHPDVRKVAFTGSVAVGQEIGHVAADRVLPLTLELGGKSANIVFADADLDFAASEAVRAFTTNAGQVCSSGTRLLVERSVHDDFVVKIADIARQIRPGTDMGPMITQGQFNEVKEYFSIARAEGATAVTGGMAEPIPGLEGGFFLTPTVYTGVDNSMRIAREEIFGPVLVVIPFDTEAEAIEIANDSDFGLVGGVWTQDFPRAIRVSEAIEAGQIYVNTWSTAAVQASFGGQKKSGYGREKGIEALNHYTQLKSVTLSLR